MTFILDFSKHLFFLNAVSKLTGVIHNSCYPHTDDRLYRDVYVYRYIHQEDRDVLTFDAHAE